MRRVFGYARVSSVAQVDGSSLGDQQNVMSKYAQERGLTVTRFFVESESGIHEKNELREQMQTLLADVRKGDLILCDKLDRWSRDPEFTYRSIREMLASGASFYAVGDACDPSTSEGDTALGFRVLFAREEHKRIKQRLVGTRKLLRDRGYYVEGLTPVGYFRPKTSDRLAHNVLQIDEPEAAIVREMFARCVAGQSVREIQTWLDDEHAFRLWERKLITTTLHSRTYLGEALDSRGVWIRGLHAPIVDSAVFAKAQVALESRRLGGQRSREDSHTKDWLLRKIGVCGACGAKLGAAYGGGRPYVYYYICTKKCGVGYARVADTDPVAADLVLARLLELHELIANGPEPAPVRDFSAKRTRLTLKRERTIETFTDGLVTREQMRASIAKVDAELAKIDELERAGRVRRDPRAALKQVSNIKRAWGAAAEFAAKREILQLLAKRVKVRKGATPEFEWKTPEEMA